MTNMKAFLMSFAVPGLAQYYQGSGGYAKLFFTTELAIWSGYYYNHMMKNARAQDYYAYAVLHAGVNPSGAGTSYLNAIGAYNSSFDYNGYMHQRSTEPVLYSGSKAWNWDAEENRLRFRNLRERELDYENNLKYCIAGAVLNHFISGLHASKLNQKSASHAQVITVNVLDGGLGATYIRSF
ncbi:ERO1 family protein [bacterium]|nr:ERO1 family protein [bacterium]